MRSIALFLATLILAAIACRAAAADARNIDKLRKYYHDHNLDFFGELIASSDNFNEDEKKRAKLELLADDARARALNQLERLLASAHGEMRAELLLRKATLLADRARTATYFQNNPFKASKLKAPGVYLNASIQAFQAVEREFPSNPKMDVVVFSIAYNFGELKRTEDSYRYYARLARKYPDSPLVGDARLAIADIHFDRRHFGDALAQLKEIVRSNHPRLKNYALYKMAWAYYNMSDLDSAIGSLERVIDGVDNQAGAAHARLELRKEALHDLVGFYAERPGREPAAKAVAYFEKTAQTPSAIAAEYVAARKKRLESYKTRNVPIPDEDRDEYQVSEPQEMLFRLVQAYRDQGKHEQAMDVAGELIAQLGRHPKTPALYRLRAEAAEKLRRRDLMIAELQKLAEAVARDLPEVAEYRDGLPETQLSGLTEALDQNKPAAVKPAIVSTGASAAPNPDSDSLYRQQLEKISYETFNDFSRFLHGEWAKTQSAETARYAGTVYDLAVKALLEPWRGHALDQCLELRARRAQLRFALKQWDLAAQDFRYLSLHVTQPESEVIDDARGEIAALEALAKEAQAQAHKSSSMNPLHERLLAAYDGFLTRFLFNKALRENAAGVLAASAQIHRDYGHDDEALRRLMFYSRQLHDQKDAQTATRAALSILSDARRWEDLRGFAESLIDSGAYKNAGVYKEIQRSREYASLKILETLEKNKDWGKAENEFAKFAAKNPDSPFASQALLKSANAALETKDPAAAVERLENAAKAPDATVRLQAWLALEPFYRKAFQWPSLRDLYENVLKLKPDAKTKAGAEQNLQALHELEQARFAAKQTEIAPNDPDLKRLRDAIASFETKARVFAELRFARSNDNPQRNFKQKADLHAKLADQADGIAADSSSSLRNAALAWATISKAELLLEFAETLDTAAMPAVLKAATANDRKAYADTLAGQAKELRDKARSLTLDAAKLVEKADSPLPLEARLNSLLEHFNENMRMTRAPFAGMWGKRPGAESEAAKPLDTEEVRKLGMRILQSDDQKRTRELLFKLAREYRRGGLTGFAYATSAELTAKNSADEPAARAARLQFEIDLARFPAELRKAVASNSLSPDQRWNLARWLAGQQGKVKIYGDGMFEKVFSKEDQEWLANAIRGLLRPSRTEAKVLAAKADLK